MEKFHEYLHNRENFFVKTESQKYIYYVWGIVWYTVVRPGQWKWNMKMENEAKLEVGQNWHKQDQINVWVYLKRKKE